MLKVIPLIAGSPADAVEAPAPNPLSGVPVTHVWRQFVHPRGAVNAGVWDCSAGSFEIASHPSHEMCAILEGGAVIEHPDGSRLSLGPGDCILIPKGAHTVWHIERYVKKTFICCFTQE